MTAVLRKIDQRHLQLTDEMVQLGGREPSIRQRVLTAVSKNKTRYKEGLPVDFYDEGWLQALLPRTQAELCQTMKPKWFPVARGSS